MTIVGREKPADAGTERLSRWSLDTRDMRLRICLNTAFHLGQELLLQSAVKHSVCSSLHYSVKRLDPVEEDRRLFE